VWQAYEGFDVAVGAIVRKARAKGHSVPCREGCSACCYDVAVATHFEIDVVLEAVWKLPVEDQAKVRRATRAWLDRARAAGIDPGKPDPDGRAYMRAKLACPLLDEAGGCRVYAARPLACRGHYIVDQPKEVCANRAEEPTVQTIILDEHVNRAQQAIFAPHVRHGHLDVKIGLVPALLASAIRVN
jgi:Fe-S-cluster containining protein